MDCSDRVLVVGAGPVGLTAAAELGRRGVAVRLVDAAAGLSTTSKAIGIHARTLELLERLDISARLVDLGAEIGGFRFHDRGEVIADLSFAGLATHYPFALSLGQDVTERVLLDRVHADGGAVEWGVRLAALRDRGDRVEVELAHPDGRCEQTTVSWVLGCDGAHSTVRQQLGVGFDGEPFPQWFLVADLHMDTALDANRINLFLSDAGATAVLPLPQPGLFRLATPLDTDALRPHGVSLVDLAAIEALWHARVGSRAHFSDARWIAPFQFQSRLAGAYRKGRVLLAGDAAHVHSPVGGQGMNAGMHDAFNLVWKLDAVRRGAPEALLDSYDAERRPVAAHMLAQTRRNAVLVSSKSRMLRAARKRMLKLVTRVRPIRLRVLEALTMLSVSYPRTALPGPTAAISPHARLGGEPSAGQRAPDAPLQCGDSTMRLHDLLRSPRHVLLCFDGGARDQTDHRELLHASIDVVVIRRASSPGTSGEGQQQLCVWDRGGVAHRVYRAHRPTSVLVRPDGVIAWRGRPSRREQLRAVTASTLPTALG